MRKNRTRYADTINYFISLPAIIIVMSCNNRNPAGEPTRSDPPMDQVQVVPQNQQNDSAGQNRVKAPENEEGNREVLAGSEALSLNELNGTWSSMSVE